MRIPFNRNLIAAFAAIVAIVSMVMLPNRYGPVTRAASTTRRRHWAPIA